LIRCEHRGSTCIHKFVVCMFCYFTSSLEDLFRWIGRVCVFCGMRNFDHVYFAEILMRNVPQIIRCSNSAFHKILFHGVSRNTAPAAPSALARNIGLHRIHSFILCCVYEILNSLIYHHISKASIYFSSLLRRVQPSLPLQNSF